MATSAHAPPLAHRPARWLLQLAPWLIGISGLTLTWIQYEGFRSREDDALKAHFSLQANEVVDRLERRLLSAADLLRGVAGLFASSDHVDRHEFRTYVEGLDLSRNYPSIQGIGYAERFPADHLAGHERQVRADGYPGYTVRPAGPRDTYTTVVYLEPFDWRNQRAFGFDMYTEPVRRTAMDRATDSGEVSMSGKVTLVQESGRDTQPGFLIYAPIYRTGQAITTPQQRREALVGWAYSPLRAHDLINSFLEAEFGKLRPRIRLDIHASTEAHPDTLLYGGPVDAMPEAATGFLFERISRIHGQAWLVRIAPVAEQWDDSDLPRTSRWILVGGAGLSLLGALVAWLLTRNHLRVSSLLESTLHANRQLAANESALRLAGTVMEVSPIGIVVTDAEQRIVSVNPAFTRITGYSPSEAIGQDPNILASGRHDADFYRAMWQQIDRTGFWEGELQNRRKNGGVYPQMLSISRVRDAKGEVVNYVGMFQDITERREAEDRIRYLAHHDHLTGLPNRAHFLTQATQELASAKRYGRRLAVLFIDLDRFKPINDTHGHEAGDAVLIGVADRLKHLLRESDLVCRQGGDEFVVLTPEYRDLDGLKELAHKLCDAIAAPYEVGELRLNLSASIGIATYPEHGQSLDALIQSADAAMYLAKSDPSERVRLAQATAPQA